MSKKTIRLFCYGPIACDKQYQSPWEDVWIQYHDKRKVVKEGPCIMGFGTLKHDIEVAEKYKDTEHLEDLRRVEVELKSSRFALIELNNGLVDIYTNAQYITRDSAEEAIDWYLRGKGILKSEPRFKWEKPGKLIVTPVGF